MGKAHRLVPVELACEISVAIVSNCLDGLEVLDCYQQANALIEHWLKWSGRNSTGKRA